MYDPLESTTYYKEMKEMEKKNIKEIIKVRRSLKHQNEMKKYVIALKEKERLGYIEKETIEFEKEQDRLLNKKRILLIEESDIIEQIEKKRKTSFDIKNQYYEKEYELFHHLLMKTTKKKDELNHLLNEDYNDIHHLEEKRKRCFEMSLEYYQNDWDLHNFLSNEVLRKFDNNKQKTIRETTHEPPKHDLPPYAPIPLTNTFYQGKDIKRLDKGTTYYNQERRSPKQEMNYQKQPQSEDDNKYINKKYNNNKEYNGGDLRSPSFNNKNSHPTLPNINYKGGGGFNPYHKKNYHKDNRFNNEYYNKKNIKDDKNIKIDDNNISTTIITNKDEPEESIKRIIKNDEQKEKEKRTIIREVRNETKNECVDIREENVDHLKIYEDRKREDDQESEISTEEVYGKYYDYDF